MYVWGVGHMGFNRASKIIVLEGAGDLASRL